MTGSYVYSNIRFCYDYNVDLNISYNDMHTIKAYIYNVNLFRRTLYTELYTTDLNYYIQKEGLIYFYNINHNNA